MILPYQHLCTLGTRAICGSKGASIYTLDVVSCTLLSSWSHPLSGKSELKPDVGDVKTPAGQDSEHPPFKKRRLGSNEEGEADIQEPEAPAGILEPAANGKSRGGKQIPMLPTPRPQEPPFVILLTATNNGSHVVAVTGQDKTIWVLEHDGKGGLKELGRRYVPCLI